MRWRWGWSPNAPVDGSILSAIRARNHSISQALCIATPPINLETMMLPLKPIGLSLVLLATASTDSINHPPTSSPGSPCSIIHPQFVPLPTNAGTLRSFLSSGFDRITPIYCPIETEDVAEFTKQLSSDTVDENRWCGRSARLNPPPEISYLVCRRNPRVCFTFALGWS